MIPRLRSTRRSTGRVGQAVVVAVAGLGKRRVPVCESRVEPPIPAANKDEGEPVPSANPVVEQQRSTTDGERGAQRGGTVLRYRTRRRDAALVTACAAGGRASVVSMKAEAFTEPAGHSTAVPGEAAPATPHDGE